MAGALCRARISNAARVRAVLIPACGVGMWLQGSQSAAALEPLAVGSTLHQSRADALVSGPPNEFGEGTPAAGLAVGPTGPTGFATAYANNYSCAFEFQPCDLGGFSGVSCASETSCTAVGTAVGNASLAEGWGGTKWTIEPTPAPSDATYSTLASVSCVIPTKCLAVGSYYGSSGELPLAELWNGSSWTIRPPPSPPEASYSVLSYVQCASTEECMAVGSYYSTSTSQTVPLAELWDGSAWTIQSVLLPSGAESGALTGVSCPAEATCSSVGAYSTPGTGQTPLAEAWDGMNWTIQSTAIPAGSSSSALHAVWCESAKSCSAVGISASSSGGSLTLAESWDGTSWTVEPTPNPNASSYNGFTNLSCAPEGKPCTAVGFSGNTTLTESWDGMTWGELPITPEPAGSTQSSFSDVSCTAPNVCTAVGQYLDSTEGPTGAYLTLAERWNGTSWTIQPTANPALAGTDAATNITSSTADLHGTVYPGGAATTCYFEYGSTSAYGSTMPCAQTTGPGAAPVSVSANLAGLSPNMTYYFNLVATNAGGGMSYTPGPASFTTLATSGGGGNGNGGPPAPSCNGSPCPSPGPAPPQSPCDQHPVAPGCPPQTRAPGPAISYFYDGVKKSGTIGGIYARVFNYKPYVDGSWADHGEAGYSEAWVMLEGQEESYAQIGWNQRSSDRITLIEYNDRRTPGGIGLRDCDASSHTQLSCASGAANPAPIGKYTYYTVLWNYVPGEITFYEDGRQVASAPASFVPVLAVVSDETHALADQIAGDGHTPEVFEDVHVFVNGQWAPMGGTRIVEPPSNDHPGSPLPWAGFAQYGDGSCFGTWDTEYGDASAAVNSICSVSAQAAINVAAASPPASQHVRTSAVVPLSCPPGGAACGGTISLDQSPGHGRLARVNTHSPSPVTRPAAFALPPGGRERLRLRLTRAALQRLRKAGRLRVQAIITGSGPAGRGSHITSRSFTLLK